MTYRKRKQETRIQYDRIKGLKVMENRKGLSAIELLVIIIIVGIAMYIIVPALQHSPPPAKSIMCQMNNREISIAMWLYCEEDDGLLFPLADEKGKYWFDLLIPYLENDIVLRCPSTRPNSDETDDVVFGTRRRAWRADGSEGGYGVNGWLFSVGKLADDNVAEADRQRLYGKISKIDLPGEVPVIGDCNWYVSWPRATDTMPTDLERGTPPDAVPTNYMGRFCIERHHHGKDPTINIGFADGHVERKRLDELWSLKWHREFETSKRPPEYEAASK